MNEHYNIGNSKNKVTASKFMRKDPLEQVRNNINLNYKEVLNKPGVNPFGIEINTHDNPLKPTKSKTTNVITELSGSQELFYKN
jgi:hypothetical protein